MTAATPLGVPDRHHRRAARPCLALRARHRFARRAAVRRLDLLAPVRRALDALGLGDRAAFDGGTLVWDDCLHARWDLTVDDADDDRSRLTVVTRFAGDDLHDAWPLAGPLADAWVRRAARAVKASAEAQSSS